jgi:methylenetetrahydrofolate reductase (NADPH)
MSLLPFLRRKPGPPPSEATPAFLSGWSIEVMPRTAEKVDSFRALLPPGTRVYVAHIDGTEIADMVATAKRLAAEGFAVMPHFPARSIPDRATLADWIARYRGEAGVTQGLILAGGRRDPAGEFESSMQLLESGLFDGFERLHVAGHPEGNRDIDADGSDRGWVERLGAEGIALPVHIGIAGPAKLQTLIKFALACGVGPSLQVLQKRAMDVTKLLLPYEPDEVVDALAARKAAQPAFGIAQVHIFPLGGIKAAADWANRRTGQAPALAATA